MVRYSDSSDSLNPKRVLGFRDLFLFYVVTGISLRWIASAATAGPSSIVIWLGAWLFFYVPLALSVIELSSRYPEEGGLYVWTRRAFGDFGGFLCAWIYWTSYFPYLPAVLYFAAGNALFIRPHAWGHLSQSSAYYVGFSLIALTLAILLNVVGLDVGKWLHNLGALAMWTPVAIILVMGTIAWRRFGSATSFTAQTLLPSVHFKEITFWAILIFAFGGSETASFLGGEIKGSRRTVPFALLGAGLTIAACYILGTVSILVALPAEQVSNLQGLMQAIAKTAERIGWQSIIPWAAVLITLSNVGATSAFLAATSRLPFVAGVDHFLPPIFGRLHSRWRTPWFALCLQGALGVVFILIGQLGESVPGAYDVLVSLGILTYFIPYLFLFAALFKLQSKSQSEPVVRVPGGRIVARLVATVGFCTAAFAIVLSVLPDPDETRPVLAFFKIVIPVFVLIAVGAWIFWAGRKRAAHAAAK